MYRNIDACKELTRVTRTSYGPNGKQTQQTGARLASIAHFRRRHEQNDHQSSRQAFRDERRGNCRSRTGGRQSFDIREKFSSSLQVEHPAAKLIVMASEMQEQEVIETCQDSSCLRVFRLATGRILCLCLLVLCFPWPKICSGW